MSTTKTLERAKLYGRTTINRIITRALLAAGATVLVSGFAFAGELDTLTAKDSCLTCPGAIAKPDSRGGRIWAAFGGRIANNLDTIKARLGKGKPIKIEVELTVGQDGLISKQKLTASCNGVKCPDGEIDKLVPISVEGRHVDAPMVDCVWKFSIVAY
jgi:hypothetical protein